MFSDAVAAHIGRQRDLVVCDFSTTGPCERAASEIVLLDAMQSYFNYEMITLCGIPLVRNEHMAAWKKGLDAQRGGGLLSEIPSGLSCVPFDWLHLSDVFTMEFLGGFVGIAQDEATLAVRPAVGWAVRDAADSPRSRGKTR